jgi:hypothetical protein
MGTKLMWNWLIDGAYMPLSCLWRKMNDKSFEDQENTLEFKSLFFKILYMWTTACLSPLTITYSDFRIPFALFS